MLRLGGCTSIDLEYLISPRPLAKPRDLLYSNLQFKTITRHAQKVGKWITYQRV